MSWQPNDLVSDADLLAYENTILTQFGQETWRSRRQKAIEDWLFPTLEGRNFDPTRFRTRFLVDAVMSSAASVTTDRTQAAHASEGLALSSLLASSGDSLYIGSTQAFRGLSIRQLDSPNTADAILRVTLWADSWVAPEQFADGTMSGNRSLSRGGAVTWRVPEGVVHRSIGGIGPYFWARLQMSASPAGCVIGPVTVIRRSRLCAAVTFRTLALIFREAPTAQDGPWLEKANWYDAEAERAWLRVADRIGGEFDSDDDDAISPTEAAQTAAAVSGGGWAFERC